MRAKILNYVLPTLALGIASAGPINPDPDPGPVATTGEAIVLSDRSAMLGGSVLANGQPTTAWFEYGLTPDLGQTMVVVLSPDDSDETQSVSVTASGLEPGTTYHYRLVTNHSKGSTAGDIRSFSTTLKQGLRYKTYDTLWGPSYLAPISNLLSVAPSGEGLETGDLDFPYDSGKFTQLNGITHHDRFSVVWHGWFDISKDGPGLYTFGTSSDDGSVIYLDLNDDGDFDDPGELVVDNNLDQTATARTRTLELSGERVRIAIGYYENIGGERMLASFRKGSHAFSALDPISGVSGHFLLDEPPPGANLWGFDWQGYPVTYHEYGIHLEVPPGTDLSAMSPTFLISPGATCVPESGTSLDFTQPVTYTVTSADGMKARIFTMSANPLPGWIAQSGGNWGDPANWAGGNIADDTHAVADFRWVDAVGDMIVTLDQVRTVGSVFFGDADVTSPGNWIVEGPSDNQLYLRGLPQRITVEPMAEGRGAVIRDVLMVAPRSILHKAGAGQLTLINPRGMGSGLVIEDGLLRFGGRDWLPPPTITNHGILSLNFRLNQTLTSPLGGSGILRQEGPGTLLINSATSHTGGTEVHGGILAVDGNQHRSRLSANHPVTVHDGGIFEIRGVNALPTGDNPVDFTVMNGGRLLIMSGSSAGMAGSTASSHAHIRNITLKGGEIECAYSGTGSAWEGYSFTLKGSVRIEGNSRAVIRNGTNVSLATAGIELLGTREFFVDDVTTGADLIVATYLKGSGFTKTGAGEMVIDRPAMHTGSTHVNAGMLTVNASLGNTAVHVAAGATLAGGGDIGGSVTIQTGGALQLPAAASPAEQANRTFGGTLSLLSGNILRIDASTPPAPGIYNLVTVAGGITGRLSTVEIPPGVHARVELFSNRLRLIVGISPDYDAWAGVDGHHLTGGPDDDDDGDGLNNFHEYAFGLDPQDPAGVAAVAPPDRAAGTFAYTRRNVGLTGLDYRYESSADLENWAAFTPVAETSDGGDAVESVTVTLPAGFADGGRLFLRVAASRP